MSSEGSGGGSRSQQSHYFAKLFSRWRNDGAGGSAMRQTENEVDVGHGQPVSSDKQLGESSGSLSVRCQQQAKGRPSASFSFPEADLTPQIMRRARWKMESRPKAKQSLDTALHHHQVVLLAEKAAGPREGDQRSSTSSPPSSPATASLLESASADHRPPSQQSIATPLWRSNAVDVSYPHHLRLQQQQHSGEPGALGSARSDISNASSVSFEFGQVDACCLESSASSTLADTASAIGDVTRTSTGSALHGLMEVRLPKFPLKKLRYKQQSFADQAVWKPTVSLFLLGFVFV